MRIFFTSGFQKKFIKLPLNIQEQFGVRIDLFIEDSSHPSLKVHPLKGNLAGLRAFSVSGDCRVIYRLLDRDSIELISIGTHSQIY
ncbi:type II toxin-antitoxin system mRNA interferase toxin, RelE/StbE family [Patescibacteria group bacterium]|nr:type II toxin-antitoxin system mRNA interferase toxin, RelE/StbE family [Patescibacteria group bacterium]MBU1954169.1 type II toxin-antitoxin system mRNA interferase toxin, RelE/StbE family [Patescibacteria group bacterium]